MKSNAVSCALMLSSICAMGADALVPNPEHNVNKSGWIDFGPGTILAIRSAEVTIFKSSPTPGKPDEITTTVEEYVLTAPESLQFVKNWLAENVRKMLNTNSKREFIGKIPECMAFFYSTEKPDKEALLFRIAPSRVFDNFSSDAFSEKLIQWGAQKVPR